MRCARSEPQTHRSRRWRHEECPSKGLLGSDPASLKSGPRRSELTADQVNRVKQASELLKEVELLTLEELPDAEALPNLQGVVKQFVGQR